jgi:glycosyltransferase involved in cell wall biosynthesis
MRDLNNYIDRFNHSESPMSLLINLSSVVTKPSGIGNYITNLLPHLQQLNPLLLTDHYFPNYQTISIPSNLSPDGGRIGHLRRLIWTQSQLPKIYQQQQATLLFSPIPEAPLYTNCRYIVTAHDLIPLRFNETNPLLKYYFRYLVPQVLNQSQHILVNSRSTADDLVNYWQIPHQKITITPLGYDSTHFKPLDLPKHHTPYFLYLGRHEAYKNIDRLIYAFSKIKGEVELWIAGSCDRRYTPKLTTLVDELNLNDRVKFLDYIRYSDLPIIINQALALVFPSLWEGFGLPVLEAMACGTPVITSNISALPEVVGDAGILINPYQVAELINAMEELIEKPLLRQQLSKTGLIQASKFTWQRTAQLTLELLKKYL